MNKLRENLDFAVKLKTLACVAEVYKENRLLWNAICAHESTLLRRCIKEHIICASALLACDDALDYPELTIRTDYGSFCCADCKQAYDDESIGEASQRKSDMRDY